jgi:pimeloyl-ACP methyl ester carboxylesterase
MHALAKKCHCLAPDQRGVGDSTAPGSESWDVLADDVAVVVRSSGEQRPVLVGHSWGAKIALVGAALGAPVAGVFCVDGIAFGSDGSLREDVYDAISCPVAAVFGARGKEIPGGSTYTPSMVADFAARHPQIVVSWLPSGHDIPTTCPDELAGLVESFARVCWSWERA